MPLPLGQEVHSISESGEPCEAVRGGPLVNINSGMPWSEMDIEDLRQSFAYGNSVAETADVLCRDVEEVEEKLADLGLVRPKGSLPQ